MEGETYMVETERDVCSLIIDLIQNYPFLLNTSHKFYKNNTKKEAAWQEISNAVNISTEECQKLWKSLRDRFTREIRSKGKSGSEGSNWHYYKKMQFYAKYSKPRRLLTKKTTRILQPMVKPKLEMVQSGDMEIPVYHVSAEVELPHTPPKPVIEPKNHVPTQSVSSAKRKISNEEELIEAVKRITECLENSIETPQPRESNSSASGSGSSQNCNRTFVEHLYSLLEDMPPEMAKLKRRHLINVMYD